MKPNVVIEELAARKVNLVAGIDLYGHLKRIFEEAVQIPGYLFLLCTRGSCTVNIQQYQYDLMPGSVAIVYPETFFRIKESAKDCRLLFAGFSKEALHTPTNFAHIVDYVRYVVERPVLHLEQSLFRILHDYIMVIMRCLHVKDFMNIEQVSLSFSQIIMALGNVYKKSGNIGSQHAFTAGRNEGTIKELLRVVVENYKQERNALFYARQLHLSPQHLSTTVKKVTGKTLTDIISSFIIRDAKAKLRSTDMTVQEIAYSLNFSNISFFGKYFKRYTGVSPRHYRDQSR